MICFVFGEVSCPSAVSHRAAIPNREKPKSASAPHRRHIGSALPSYAAELIEGSHIRPNLETSATNGLRVAMVCDGN